MSSNSSSFNKHSPPKIRYQIKKISDLRKYNRKNGFYIKRTRKTIPKKSNNNSSIFEPSIIKIEFPVTVKTYTFCIFFDKSRNALETFYVTLDAEITGRIKTGLEMCKILKDLFISNKLFEGDDLNNYEYKVNEGKLAEIGELDAKELYRKAIYLVKKEDNF